MQFLCTITKLIYNKQEALNRDSFVNLDMVGLSLALKVFYLIFITPTNAADLKQATPLAKLSYVINK